MSAILSFTAVALIVVRAASAQTAADHIALGDREHAANRPAAALAHYEAALGIDSVSYEALWRASRDAVDAGELATDGRERGVLYGKGESYARRSVRVRPGTAESHFALARAVGRNALTMGTRDRVKYAGVVHDEALAALAIDPKHAGALHIMGVWNAEIMRLNSVSRLLAKTVLGGKVFGEASWENAQRYLERAMAAEPDRIVHRLDLAAVLVDRKDTKGAREQYEWIVRAPIRDASDRRYKQEADEALKKLR
jgi:tetratricopeptide (TPR) repeat protein